MKTTPFRTVLLASLATLLVIFAAPAAFAQAAPEPSKGPSAFYVERKHEEAKVGCEDCHAKAKKSVAVPLERCVKCHGKGDAKAFAATTANVKPTNPHNTRHYGTEANCGLCHLSHDDSVNYCADCHPRFQFNLH